MIKRYFVLATVAAALAGCGSSVKLDPPIQDSASSTTSGAGMGAGAGTGTQGQGAGQSSVAPVQVDASRSDVAGPTGVDRVIYFDYDSFVVQPAFQSVVDQHARFLQANRGRSVVLEGNTDERGSREYNLALGQKRSEAVRRALTLVGATDSQIEAVSFGEEKPAVSGSGEEAFAKNRRVELRYR